MDRSILAEVRIEHSLHGGDSPDIPIPPVYVEYLNRVRHLARAAQ